MKPQIRSQSIAQSERDDGRVVAQSLLVSRRETPRLLQQAERAERIG
jgi:hypothetical protein